MANQAHCAYCFEALAANFERRQPLSLTQVEELWEQGHASKSKSLEEDTADLSDDEDAEMTDAETEPARPAAISRLLNRNTDRSATSSSSSLPSTSSSKSSAKSGSSGSGSATPASSMSSNSRTSLSRRESVEEEHPLFVTWNTVSKSGHKSLRGCIGTFEPQELEYGLRSYALTR